MMTEPKSRPLSTGIFTLQRDVSAMEIEVFTDDGQPRLGLITELTRGALLHVRGAGFDNRTIMVQANGSFYYVFLEDLESAAAGRAFK